MSRWLSRNSPIEGSRGEPVHAVVDAGRVYEHGRRSVDDVARGELPCARLQAVLEASGAPAGRDAVVDREDRADGHVDVDVGRAVEGIEQEHVGPDVEPVGDGDDAVALLRDHAAEVPGVVHRLEDDLLRECVELLDLLAVDVLLAGAPEDVDEPGHVDLARDDLGGERDVVEERGEAARGARVQALLVDDVPVDRDDFAAHGGEGRARGGGGQETRRSIARRITGALNRTFPELWGIRW